MKRFYIVYPKFLKEAITPLFFDEFRGYDSYANIDPLCPRRLLNVNELVNRDIMI